MENFFYKTDYEIKGNVPCFLAIKLSDKDLINPQYHDSIRAELKKFIYIKTNVMQLGSMFTSNCNNALHVSDAFCVHPQEHIETVVAASGV